ncbi:MAG: sulfonate ABC transporter ATP-binding protein [Sphingomonas sp.]|nr:MAG: sulfonate ABC transporter ATP-binding protein [Sphingomonas sp.]
MSERKTVRLRGLRRSFNGTDILRGLDLDIAPGEFVALLGRSGSGKTTLLRTLAGLDAIDAEEAIIPASRAVVFQDARLLPWRRAWHNVAFGLRGEERRQRAEAALVEVGLGHRIDAWPLTLSGGEGQRVALARALVREPSLLLLDEPFSALDALTRRRMHELVTSLWQAHNPSVLLVTHDIDEALLLASRVLILDQGRIVEEYAAGEIKGERRAPARSGLEQELFSRLSEVSG